MYSLDAVYHRAYDEREPIEGLKNYHVSSRRYRNRRIGVFLKELHLTEGRNTGFKKILDALDANDSPKPEFETDDARTYFIIRLFIHEKFLNEELKGSQKGADIGIVSRKSNNDTGATYGTNGID